MPVEKEAEIELLASQLDHVQLCAKLKIQGLSEKHLNSIAPFFDIEFQSVTGHNVWQAQTRNREFGSHKIQTVRLLAAALLIQTYFPETKMALTGSVDIEAASPLTISDASQIFLKQAGFDLKVETEHRILNASEMLALKNQLEQMQGPQQRRKGA